MTHAGLLTILAGTVACTFAGSFFAAAAHAQAGPAAPAPDAVPPRGPAAASTLSPGLEVYENRPLREVRIQGLKDTPEQLVRNQLRSQAGRPLSQATVQGDIQRVTRLGRFRSVNALIQPFDDGSVLLVYEFSETVSIRDVQVTGNREITDAELRGEVELLRGTPVDPFQLDRTLRRIQDLYRRKGYYQAQVTIDQKELDENSIVLFLVREGERVRVTDVRFEGNADVTARELRQTIRTRPAGLLQAGTLDDAQLDQDVAGIVGAYRDRGYLDVRADRQVRPSPNGREAIVTFLVEQGPLYTLRSVRVQKAAPGGLPDPTGGEPTTVFSPEQLAALAQIKPGDVYSADRVARAVDAVRDAYGRLGYVDAAVARLEVRDPQQPVVDLLLAVTEGGPSKTGLVIIRGNELTQDKIIRREIEVKPDRPLDTVAIRDSQTRLNQLGLFAGAAERDPGPRITIQPPDPANPGYRDVLVEVTEKNTGSIQFGAAISSDSGVLGLISLEQRNFDLFDTPDSVGEFISGRAFRGAGQRFRIDVQPGTEVQNYSISLSEPALFDTPYSVSGSAGYREREFDEFSEDRLVGNLSVGRRFGQRWAGAISLRGENINIRELDPFAAVDFFNVRGSNTLTGLGTRLTRTTTDSRIRPTRGSRLELSTERIGAAGGDFDFTKLSAEYIFFFPVAEDVLGRKTVFSLRTLVNYIPEDVEDTPVFERFFLGGRNLRGFRFRGVSPRGLFDDDANPATPPVQGTEPVGGTFAFLTSPEIEVPLFEDLLSVVFFTDIGTVANEIELENLRLSVGTGLRLTVPALGPAPLAFDFGFPILREEDDRERVFSFSIDIPF